METSVKFAFTQVGNSITNPNTLTKLDVNAPFSFIQFLKNTNSTYNPTVYNEFYIAYVREWYAVSNVKTNTENEYIQKQYVELLKEINLTYTSDDERRYLQNINFNDKEDLEIVIPFYVKKIKEIILFYKERRDKIKFVVEKNKRKTTEFGIERAVKENIVDYLFDSTIRTTLKLDIPTITNDLIIDVEDLVDTFGEYLDLSNPPSEYGGQTREQFFTANYNEIVADDLLDLQNSLNKILFNNVFLTQLGVNFTINVNLNYDPVCSPANPIGEFIESKTVGGIQPNQKTQVYQALLEKYVGVDFYYAQRNSAGELLSGVLLTAANPSGNLVNIRNASTATVPADQLLALKKLGLFFSESNLGMLRFNSTSFAYTFDFDKIKNGETYVFPDPTSVGSNTPPVIFTINNTADVENISYGYIYGDVSDKPKDQSFFAYFSNDQTFETSEINSNGLRNDQFAELYNNGYAYDWKQDVYGNEYGIFKDKGGQYSYGILEFTDIAAYTNTVKFLPFNGWLFTDFRPASSEQVYIDSGPYNGIDTVYMSGISANGGTFTSTAQPYYLNFRSFVPYQDIPSTYNLYPTLDSKTFVLKDTVLSENNSVLSNLTGTDTFRDVNSKLNLDGKLFVKNVQTGSILPLSTALVNTFSKYPSAVKTEVYNNVKDFELYYNTIVLYTQNYLVIDKLVYTANGYEKPKTLNIYVSGGQNAFNSISNTFFLPEYNKLFFFVTNLSGFVNDNYKVIYPTLYSYDINANKLVKLFPLPNVTFSNLRSNFSLVDYMGDLTIFPINFVEVSTPRLSYNSYNDLFVISFIAKDSNKSPYLFDYKFKYKNDAITIEEANLYDITEVDERIKTTANFYSLYAYSNPYPYITTVGTLADPANATSLPFSFNATMSSIVTIDFTNGFLQI